MLTNIATSIVLRYHRAGRRVRYEDLARHTRVTLSDIMYQVGVEVESTQYNFSDMEHHNLSGNYMRCKKGQVIREDTDYLHANAVGPFKWWVATFMTLPFLLLYGYPLSRRF